MRTNDAGVGRRREPGTANVWEKHAWPERPRPGSGTFILAIVSAQVLTQIGAFALPALLPGHIARWHLSGTEAGWLVGSFFAAYVAAVPALLAMTDRLPVRLAWLTGAALTAVSQPGFALVADGFWSGLVLRAIAGVGWAGACMPGLKAIADPLEGVEQSRAVSMHAAGVAVSGAASFMVAGLPRAVAGPSAAFLFGAAAAAGAFVIAVWVMPAALPARAGAPPSAGLLDFRPVFRNRAALAWIIGYTVHTWELAALRAWGVTFLTVAIARQGAPEWLPGPTVPFTVAGPAGIAVSVTGNELARRFGRFHVVILAIGGAALLSLVAGWGAAVSAPLAAALVGLWNATIYLDSSALTAGTVAAADRHSRGATMRLHSMAGYAGGFLGPLGVGLILDLAGRDTLIGWGLGFGHLAVVTLVGLAALRWMARSRQPSRGANVVALPK